MLIDPHDVQRNARITACKPGSASLISLKSICVKSDLENSDTSGLEE